MKTAYGICPLCNRISILQWGICNQCTAEIMQLRYDFISNHRCPICLAPQLHRDAVCTHLDQQIPTYALLAHRQRAKQLITRFEKDGIRPLRHFIATLVTQALQTIPQEYGVPMLALSDSLSQPMRQVAFACHRRNHVNLFRSSTIVVSINTTRNYLVVLSGTNKDTKVIASSVQELKQVVDIPIITLCITKD